MKRVLMMVLLASPFVLSLRLERVWDRFDVNATKYTQEQTGFENDWLGSVAGAYPLDHGLAITGRAGYRFHVEQPTYALGVEYTFHLK